MLNMKSIENIVFATALAIIGFTVDIERVILAGCKPLPVAFIGWVGMVLFFFLVAPLIV